MHASCEMQPRNTRLMHTQDASKTPRCQVRSGCLSHVPHADTVRRERNVPHEPITALHTCVRPCRSAASPGSAVERSQADARLRPTGCERARTGRAGAIPRTGWHVRGYDCYSSLFFLSSSCSLVFRVIVCLIHNGCSAGLVFLILISLLPTATSIYPATLSHHVVVLIHRHRDTKA